MVAKITDKELLDLYDKFGNAQAVSDMLSTSGITLSKRGVQHRLHVAYPNYVDDHGKRKRVKQEENTKPVAAGTVQSPDKQRHTLVGQAFVFTTAQNNTYVHKEFLASLKTFCEHKKAQLIVSTTTYNKSGFQNGTKDSDVWYDPLIKPYIINESCTVAKDLIFCGELDVLPTAVYPLSGFENYTRDASGIIPHTKVQMQSLPRMKDSPGRFMYTTGAVTQRNYIQRKAGQKAGFHHVFGALFVEIDANGEWFARQLIANESGVFHDLNECFTPDSISPANVEAITWGDIHIEKIDVNVFMQAWGNSSSMLQTLNPSFQFIHDLTDFTARNHHNIRDPFYMAKMHHQDTGNVERDMKRSGSFLQHITRLGNTAVVVESNHDQAFQKWLREADVRIDPENAEYFHTASALVHKNIREGNYEFNVYEWAVTDNGAIKSKTIFLREDDSFQVCGIEQGLHGHRGPNGARGNPKGFKTLGRKVNIGHMHTAAIIDGVYVAGVSGRLDMDYNKGPSSWSHSHIVTYANGKRAMITMKNGKWRA